MIDRVHKLRPNLSLKGEGVMKSESFFINLGTMTYALRAEGILKDKGIECRAGKNPEFKNERGCMWGVFVKGAVRESVVNLLRINHLNIL